MLEFIQAEIGAGRPFPTNKQIAAHMGRSIGTVSQDLVKLATMDRLLTREYQPGKRHPIYALRNGHA